MRRLAVTIVVACVVASAVLWPRRGFSHETLTTTVLFDREIVRILNKHCVMCHVENGPSFPLATYEQTWLQGRKVRAEVIARHMPPWAAVPGYGQFANDNGLTLRETQFVVSWVEGLGPRNAGTVFTNVANSSAPRKDVRASLDFGRWQLGEPGLTRPLPAASVEATGAAGTRRVVVDLGLTFERMVRAIEYQPGDRRLVRAADFSVQETGQWLGSWTPWYGWVSLPSGVAYRLPAGAHIAADFHYGSTNARSVEQGALGLFFADQPSPNSVSDLVLVGKGAALVAGRAERIHAKTVLTEAASVLALRFEPARGVQSLEVAARRPDGGTEILLLVKEPPIEWPTPYILKEPVKLPRGTRLSFTAYRASNAVVPAQGEIRLVVSKYETTTRIPRGRPGR